MFMQNVVVDTLAGNAAFGSMDGAAAVATFSNPVSVIVEPVGTLIVCDFDSDRIRRVDMLGTVSTVTSTAPGFLRPFGLGYGADGSLYVDTDYNPSGVKNKTSGTIWRLDPATGAVTVVATNLGRPRGFAGLPDGRLMLADYQNARVRLLDPMTGAVSDLAGDPACPGMADGQGTAARFDAPYSIAPLPDGSCVVADYENHRLRRVTLTGQVTTYAGDGGSGTVDGPRLAARFVEPKSIVADAAGNIYVADADAHTIRRVGNDGTVTTVAGDGIAGFKDGPGSQAEFYGEEGITISADGRTLFVADGNGGEADPYNRIRRITLGP
jgi:sugar lactone lactonase YvrE